MKNIHILPTDKPTTLFKDDFGNFIYSINIDQEQNHFEPQHLFITSDEEIKEGDWYIYLGKINKRYRKNNNAEYPYHTYQKIILTTDQDLIKDGVQAIDDEFLEWFVKNSSCEEVEVESNKCLVKRGSCGCFEMDMDCQCLGYKIIIPKEELEQETVGRQFHKTADTVISVVRNKETLEEREPYWELVDKKAEKNNTIDLDAYANGIRDGAKWQAERMYSEEDLKRAFEAGHKKGFSGYPNTENWKELPFEKWFEQFKKK